MKGGDSMGKTASWKILARFLLLCILLPVMTITAFADSYTILTGITAEVTGEPASETFSGGTLTVTAKGSGGFMGFGKYDKTATITISNDSGSKGVLSFNWKATNVNSLTINGKDYSDSGSDSVREDLSNKGEIKIVITTAKNGTENKLEMSNFQFEPEVDSSKVTFVYDESLGSVTVGGKAIANGATVDVSYKTGAALAATAKGDSKFLGWIKADDHSVISKDATYTLQVAADTTVQAVFANASSKAWFDVNGYLFDNLNDAVTKGSTVVLAWDGVLEQGDYTVPGGVTLLIPFDDANTLYTSEPGYNSASDSSYSTPKAYRTLTMKKDANLTVLGAMSLSAKFYTGNGGSDVCGAPTGNVSFVRMETGSSINVSGSLYAWGFITGDGSITANSGASIYENFQFTDFRGGTQSTQMDNDVFPISQYYVQNIEVPLTLHSGAKEITYTGVNVRRMDITSAVNFIGASNSMNSMFNLTSGYIVKRYDGATDRLVIDLYGGMTISSLEINLAITSIHSGGKPLPINSNITVNLRDGSSVICKQNLALLPGVQIIIDKGASFELQDGSKKTLFGSSTIKTDVYVYGGGDWGNYCGAGNKQFIPIKYAPGKTYTRTAEDLVDASILVNGTLDAGNGYLYTTENGANIYNKGSGKVVITPGSNTSTYQLVQGTGNKAIPVTSAQLHNGGMGIGTADYTATAGAAKETTYHYCTYCDKWYTGSHYTVKLYVDGSETAQTSCSDTNPVTFSDVTSYIKSQCDDTNVTVSASDTGLTVSGLTNAVTDVRVWTKAVAQIGETQYVSLREAVEDYGETGYIKMIGDTTEPGFAINKNVYLDMNGHTASVTLNDGVILYGMDSSVTDYTSTPKGKLTCSGGTVSTITENSPTGEYYVAIPNKDKSVSFYRYNIFVSGYRFELDGDYKDANGEEHPLGALIFQATLKGNNAVVGYMADVSEENNIYPFGFTLNGVPLQGTKTGDNSSWNATTKQFEAYWRGYVTKDNIATDHTAQAWVRFKDGKTKQSVAVKLSYLNALLNAADENNTAGINAFLTKLGRTEQVPVTTTN